MSLIKGENILKKGLIIFGSAIVIIAIALIIFVQTMKSGVTGNYEFASGDDGCFTDFKFTDRPSSARVISFSHVSGHTKTVYLGPIKTKGDTMHITVNNFEDIDPFDMIYELKDDQLTLNYTWENNEYSCMYKKEE